MPSVVKIQKGNSTVIPPRDLRTITLALNALAARVAALEDAVRALNQTQSIKG